MAEGERIPHNRGMRELAIVTVVAKNYWSFACVLAQSLRHYHPNLSFFVLLSDEVEGCFDPGSEPVTLLELEEVAVPNLSRVRFRCDRKQLAITSKPYVLSHLLDRGFESVIFLDPDILITGDLEELFSVVRRHPIVLMPHLLAPLSGGDGAERELTILKSGVYNGGFVGVSAGSTARRFLRWWGDRVSAHCRHDVAQGVYYDQRWLDLAPVFFPGLHIFRDPSYNVAYWNVRERGFRLDEPSSTVDGRPCRFFHFSGFDPDTPDGVSRYLSRLTLSDMGPAAEMYRRYRHLLEAASYHESKGWPYAYGRFDNGVEVSPAARQAYGELGAAVDRFGDPFETAPSHSFFRWLSQPRARRA
jgi:hypothetical protein